MKKGGCHLWANYITYIKNVKTKILGKIYLFKSGIFYIALEEDATFLSELLGFKLTNFNETVMKCGFPRKKTWILSYYFK